MASKDNYSSQNIKVLKGLEAVRVRPGMYIGNTDDGSGLHHMIYEVTDNSVDEALAGHCSAINIVLHADGSASIEDNGRGIPIDIHEEEGVSAAQVIMTQLHAGGKFDQDTYKISGGLHGVGISVVNALSNWLELIIIRNKKCYFMRFIKGDAEAPLQEISADQYQSFGEQDPNIHELLRKKTSGTYIRFTPDDTIFSAVEFSFKTLKTRYRELSFLNPTLTFNLIDQRDGAHETFYDEGGVKNFVLMNAKNQTLLFDQPFNCRIEKDGIGLDIALVWTSSSYDDHTLCFTNNIPQKEGGTHLQGFRTGLTKIVQRFIPENKIKGMTCSGEDIREGMYCVLSAKVPNPRFASQTKEKLVSTEVRSVVEHAIQDTLGRWLEENPHCTKLIVERILESIKAKEAAKRARELVRKNKAPDAGLSVAGKLADCSQKDPSKRELFLVEGQSAGGTAKMARNRETQAVLALQGKLLNVEKAALAKILQYEAIRLLIAVLGTGVGDECFAADSKYHKIIIMTDADVDGSHIRTLLLTFFFRYMKPLVEAGYLYVSRPPLYAIKSKKHAAVYLKDDRELDAYVLERVGKVLTIIHNEKELTDKSKERFYTMALRIKKEIRQFGALTRDFLESGALLTQDPITLENHLKSRFEACKVEIIDGSWIISVQKHAKTIKYSFACKTLSSEVCKFISSWGDVEVKVGNQTYSKASLIDFNDLIEKLQSNLFDVSRFKGLGEMNPKELKDTGIKPESRIIEQISIDDLESTDYITKLLMGDDVPLRRKFIEDNALNANVDL